MTDIAAFRTALTTLWDECFRGVPEGEDSTWFVQGHEGIFDALAACDATTASKKAGENVTSIAAHVAHTRFYLWLTNESLAGTDHDGDWDASWSPAEVDESAWAMLKADLRTEFGRFREYLEAMVSFPDSDEATQLAANVAHAAFHLGAIRQLLRLVQKEADPPIV